jgi:hypothetical protein
VPAQAVTTARPNKKGVSDNQEPRLLGCRYLSVRKGNLTCEASRQGAAVWKHRSGRGLAEIGRLNTSEHRGSVKTNRLKVLTSLNQKVSGQVRRTMAAATVAIIPAGPEDAAAPVVTPRWATG